MKGLSSSTVVTLILALIVVIGLASIFVRYSLSPFVSLKECDPIRRKICCDLPRGEQREKCFERFRCRSSCKVEAEPVEATITIPVGAELLPPDGDAWTENETYEEWWFAWDQGLSEETPGLPNDTYSVYGECFCLSLNVSGLLSTPLNVTDYDKLHFWILPRECQILDPSSFEVLAEAKEVSISVVFGNASMDLFWGNESTGVIGRCKSVEIKTNEWKQFMLDLHDNCDWYNSELTHIISFCEWNPEECPCFLHIDGLYFCKNC